MYIYIYILGNKKQDGIYFFKCNGKKFESYQRGGIMERRVESKLSSI